MTIAESTAIHARIRDLLPRVHDQRVFFREHARVDAHLRVPGSVLFVDRDRIFNALISKAAETHQAILVLTQARLANDAKALLRVLVDNSMVVSWILQDTSLRLDCFATALQFTNNRFAEVLQEYYPGADASDLAVAKEVTEDTQRFRELMGGNHTSWARKFDDAKGKLVPLKIYQMFEDIIPAGGDSFIYNVAYFDGSAYIHSTVTSLKNLVQSDSVYFGIAESKDDEGELEDSLFLANVVICSVLADFQRYAGVDLEPDLERIFDDIRTSVV